MDLCALIEAYRDRSDDDTAPYRVDDTRVMRWLNEAVDEACIRASLIFDVASPMCSIALVPGQASYRLAPEIQKINAAWSDKFRTTLEPTDQSALDQAGAPYPVSRYRYGYRSRGVCFSEYWSQWRTQTGHPRYYLRDDRTLRLVPIPTDADTLHLEVYRTPTDAEQMKDGKDCPRIATIHHAGLVDWALYRAYMRRDEDQYDAKLAANQFGLFEARFGVRPDAQVLRKRAEHRSHVTAINWP